MTTPESTVEEVLEGIKSRSKIYDPDTYDFTDVLRCANALQAVLAMCSRNGYTTWDRDKVPLIDGKYDEEECKKWETEHGHDIRLKCYPEFGCQLLIDPQDVREAIERELRNGI